MTDDEVDVMVEEKVFGRVPCDQWRYMSFGAAGGPVALSTCEHRCYSSDRSLPHPEYTKNIRSAWLVVQEMKRVAKFESNKLWVEFCFILGGSDHDDGLDLSWALWNMDPRHICVAALKAVGAVRDVNDVNGGM